MSSTDKLDINTVDLAAAAAKAAATQAASGPSPITSPPAASAGSPVDAAAVAVAESIHALLEARDTADFAAAAEQTAALTESPPVIVEQDHQGADEITTAAGAIPEFPMPNAGPSAPGQIWTT
ncbi:hypothetical protein [Mycobacterium riyadhense]|uniref:hypothetical protein n=1 Tax=Mycobacterium riyadhense TaxID=486698 RepID=UPI00195D8787|nr:hypothetical protein [Mycobacterium riyadhense]